MASSPFDPTDAPSAQRDAHGRSPEEEDPPTIFPDPTVPPAPRRIRSRSRRSIFDDAPHALGYLPPPPGGEDPTNSVEPRLAPPARAGGGNLFDLPREPSDEEKRDRARKLAEEAKARLQAQNAPDASQPKKSLAERTRKPKRKLSAKEALELAREAETPPPVKKEPAPPPPPVAAQPEPASTPWQEWTPPQPQGLPIPLKALDGAEWVRDVPVSPAEALSLWGVWRRTAAHGQNLHVFTAACMILDLLKQGGSLRVGIVQIGEHQLAAWLDAERGVPLALLNPANRWLPRDR